MSYFTFRQNNPGGKFELTDTIGHFVIVEAASAAEADERARRIGLYFDGVDEGRDCPCCGDRWYRMGDKPDDQFDVPTCYGVPLAEALRPGTWDDTGEVRDRALLGPDAPFQPYAVVHRLDGSVETVGKGTTT